MGYAIAPITVKESLRWVAETHRHLPKLQGALFGVSVEYDGVRVGVAVSGNPARVWQGTGRAVISRCACVPNLPNVFDRHGEPHAAPACTLLYGRSTRILRLMGYKEAWTYTLEDEDGRSVKAAGFELVGYSPDTTQWGESRPNRARVQTGPKGRWRMIL